MPLRPVRGAARLAVGLCVLAHTSRAAPGQLAVHARAIRRLGLALIAGNGAGEMKQGAPFAGGGVAQGGPGESLGRQRRSPGDGKRVALMGLLGVGCFQTLWQHGVPLTSAANAAILANTTPLWAAVMAPLIGQKVSGRAWAGIAICFAGVFLVINGSVTELRLGGGGLLGDLMIFFGSHIGIRGDIRYFHSVELLNVLGVETDTKLDFGRASGAVVFKF